MQVPSEWNGCGSNKNFARVPELVRSSRSLKFIYVKFMFLGRSSLRKNNTNCRWQFEAIRIMVMKWLGNIRSYFKVFLWVSLHFLALKNMFDIPCMNREGASLEKILKVCIMGELQCGKSKCKLTVEGSKCIDIKGCMFLYLLLDRC